MRASSIAISAAVISLLILLGTSNVIALITGSHTIIDLRPNANDINCKGCHQKIQDELDRSEIHEGMTCEDCHRNRFEQNITFARHDETGFHEGKEAHACYIPRCLDCHSKTSITLADGTPFPIKKAAAFGDADYGTDYEAHKRFVLESLDNNLSVGENEACIACHTGFPFDIDYTYFWNIDYKLSNWIFTSFSYAGTRTYGNTLSQNGGKHSFVSTGNISCIKCHKNIYDALVIGTGGTPKYLTHAPVEIASGMHGWDNYNPWNNYRYHYVPSANRAAGINSNYCYKCHNVKKYADENPSDNLTYNLASVASDTNSTHVHAAEALWCQTCHGSGKEKQVIDNPRGCGGMGGGDEGGHGAGFVDTVKNNYARTFNGDICMGCHEAAVHPGGGGGQCGRCHNKGNADVSIESEPSGYATNN
jgi:hypothetical protein